MPATYHRRPKSAAALTYSSLTLLLAQMSTRLETTDTDTSVYVHRNGRLHIGLNKRHTNSTKALFSKPLRVLTSLLPQNDMKEQKLLKAD
jgi:hypothetical protein